MKKIVIDGVIFSLQRTGGISVYFKTLLKTLEYNRLETTVILEDPLQQSFVEEFNIHISRRDARLFERYRSCRLLDIPSIFHSSYYRLPSIKNVPTVVTVHDFIYERYFKGPSKLVHSIQKKLAIRAAQAVICVSEATKQDLLEFVGETPGQQIYVIHNGVDDAFTRIPIEPVTKPFVLFVGQRAGYKNFSLALEAMSFLPELELHCVGGGVIKEAELFGFPESVINRVRHLGFVTDKELNVLYNGAVCLLYPSRYEGFGIPVIEAMRAGCPVVSSNCSAVLEVGGNALSVAYEEDPRILADAILKTMSSDRNELIRKGMAVAGDYSWENTHHQTLAVYKSLIA